MAFGSVITIDMDRIRRELGGLADAWRDPAAMAIAAKAVENELRKHFRKKAGKGNKRGWTSSGFWSEIRESTQSRRDGSGAIVEVNDPRLLTHVYGATIRPKRGKALAIPLAEEAYGRSPKTFEPGELFRLPKTNVLVKDAGNDQLKLMYALVSSTKIPKDDDAIPKDDALLKAAGDAVQRWWRRKLGV